MRHTSTPKLSLANLYKSYGSLEVLKNINITIKEGEFVSVIGPSGCGKTTLFNIIAGIEKETSGSVVIDGNENSRLGKSGYMLQKPLLLPWKTVEENIMLGLIIRHVSEKKAKELAESLLIRFKLIEFKSVYPAVLSGGMSQRIALLRTVLFNSDFLLMDEPFGALDTLTRLAMQMWLLEVWNEFKSSVLLITHDVREAILLSDRIYIVSQRPATLLRDISINLPRPRSRSQLSTKQAVELEEELENILLKEQIIR